MYRELGRVETSHRNNTELQNWEFQGFFPLTKKRVHRFIYELRWYHGKIRPYMFHIGTFILGGNYDISRRIKMERIN